MTHLLTFTSLYPNEAQPRHGVFVEERLRQLTATGRIRATVMAPVPWFPSGSPRFGRYGEFARVPRQARRHGMDVLHPRYPVIPKVGMGLAPFLMAAALLPAVRQLCRERPDIAVLDSHFLYPDGVAACLIGQRLGLPVLMTARGSDVNVFARHRVPRALIRWAARRCARIITVSESLRDSLLALGVEPARVVTLRNGVDLERFRPQDRSVARQRTGIQGTTLLSVGNLFELKGHHLVIEALVSLPGVSAVILGDGPERSRLENLARRLGVGDRVRLPGNVPQAELPGWYNAADALVLASSREGMPNVVLESLACGTPVIATNVGGIPEVMTSEAAGILLAERSASTIASAVTALLAAPPDRAAVAAHGAGFGWGPTVAGLLDVIEAAARAAS